jgi:hypothetical protein
VPQSQEAYPDHPTKPSHCSLQGWSSGSRLCTLPTHSSYTKKTMSPSQFTQAVESGVKLQSPSHRKVGVLPRDTLSTPPSHNSKLIFLLAHLGTRRHQSACLWTPWRDDTLSPVYQKQLGGRTPIPCTFNNLNKAIESYIRERGGKNIGEGDSGTRYNHKTQLEYDGSAIQASRVSH